MKFTRRGFLQGIGAGALVLAAGEPNKVLAAEEAEKEKTFRPNVWVSIEEDDTVRIWTNKSEMGQGVYTALPMILAEELGADWEKIKVEPPVADAAYNDPASGMMSTGGSSSVRHMYAPLRQAGAAAREMLLLAGAKALGVKKEDLVAEKGEVRHLASGKSLPFGKLVLEASRLSVPENPPLKEKSKFTLVGQNLPRVDNEEKISGRAIYAIDVFVPEMRYAAFLSPPVYGAKLAGYDKKAALAVPGVEGVFETPSGVVVVAQTITLAWKGRQALAPLWEGGRSDFDDAFLRKALLSSLEKEGKAAREDGGAKEALAQAKGLFSRRYVLPYLAHATLEPQSCVAVVEKNRCEVWIGTQMQTGAKALAMKKTGLGEDKVHIHTTYLGGGFGRRAALDVLEHALDAALAAKVPIKLIYSREDDFQAGFYRPANASHIQAALDARGKPTFWGHKIAVPSIFEVAWPARMAGGIDPAAVEGLTNLPYGVPRVRVEWVKVDLPPGVWWWRSVGSTHNAFTVERFVDELALQARQDPLEYRLALLEKNPRAKKVLQTAAEASGWGRNLSSGRALGIAYHFSFGSHVAEVAEASVDKTTGAVRVHKVWVAVDCGSVIHPDIVAQQMEGGVMMAMSAALGEEVRFSQGGVTSTNFHAYPLLRADAACEVETKIVESGEALGGIGEPGVPPLAPALANAIAKATGAQIHDLPLTPERVRAAMA